MRKVSGLYLPNTHWKQTKPEQYNISSGVPGMIRSDIPNIKWYDIPPNPSDIPLNNISDLVENLKWVDDEIYKNYAGLISCKINYPLMENIPKGIFAFRVNLEERKEGNLENLIRATSDLFMIAGVVHIPEEGIDIMNEALKRLNYNEEFKKKMLGGYKLVDVLQENAPPLAQ